MMDGPSFMVNPFDPLHRPCRSAARLSYPKPLPNQAYNHFEKDGVLLLAKYGLHCDELGRFKGGVKGESTTLRSLLSGRFRRSKAIPSTEDIAKGEDDGVLVAEFSLLDGELARLLAAVRRVESK